MPSSGIIGASIVPDIVDQLPCRYIIILSTLRCIILDRIILTIVICARTISIAFWLLLAVSIVVVVVAVTVSIVVVVVIIIIIIIITDIDDRLQLQK